ncbi:tripartite tricarboxylate transporter substrate binding protein [Ottowia caeni]|uniref:Bug family tripartite tricarboxylate transporter substrate binding protein n=1 Tax=Ottowia caeni TaxID=2870339 RepID=UPI001E4D808B|nr:tripartite tricarboxylate transporter substrate binding protein [Ottowia caeni]
MNTPTASRRTLIQLLSATAATAALPALANTWPERTVRIIAPFTPGAATDFVSRALAQKLSELLGQSVVVENRPGAAGTIAAEAVAKAASDGYTILFGEPGGVAVAPAVMGNLRFDAARDLTPVAQAVSLPMIVLAHPSVEANDLQSLGKLARRKSMDYATNGTGSVQHLTMELLASKLGIKMVHVPYRGGSLAINDLIAGQVPLSMLTVPTAATYIKSGKVKALGILDSRRSPLLPDVATGQEQGIEDASLPIWGGLFAPSQTPKAIVQRLSEAMQTALKDPGLRQRLEEAGNDVVFRNPAEFGAVVKSDSDRWRKLVASAGIKLE